MGRDPAKSQVLLKMQLPDCHPELVFSKKPRSARGNSEFEPKQARGIRTLANVSQKVTPCNEKRLSPALGSHKLLPLPLSQAISQNQWGFLTSKRCLCTQQSMRKLNTRVPKWLRLSRRHQSEALVHNEHEDFSLWHRKSLAKCWNNTDLISWLEFLGMLSSEI